MRGTDLTQAGMTALIGDFLEAAPRRRRRRSSTTPATASRSTAQNYLVPVDASLRSRADIDELDHPARRHHRRARRHAGHPPRLPRRLPQQPALRLGPVARRAARDGLARVGDAAGFLFAFATQPDNVAYDGVGRNSFFAQALLGHLNTPGQDVASMMIAVRKDVLAATGGNQVPWENSSLTRQFAFAPGEDGAAPETLLWQLAATARDPALMRIYLDRYPEGPHSRTCARFLADAEEPAPAGDIEVASRDLRRRRSPNSLWELAQRTRMRPLVETYLRHIPRRPPRRRGPQAARRPAAAGRPGRRARAHLRAPRHP